MHLNLETDYGLRCLLYLAQKKTCISSSELKKAAGIRTPEHVRKILRKLRQHGFVEAKRGVEGGYTLKKAASDILLGDVIAALEDTVCLNRCLEKDSFCSRNMQESCPLRKYYLHIQKLLAQAFHSVSIQDILDENYEKDQV